MKFTKMSFVVLKIAFLVILFYKCDSKTSVHLPTLVYPEIDSYPSVSPDGTKILYYHSGIIEVDEESREAIIDVDSMGLWIVNIDGSNPHILLKGQSLYGDWSPDGNWIVYSNGNVHKVPFEIDSIDTSNVVQLTTDGGTFPAWSPNGIWIAYESDKNDPKGANVIWIMKADGTEKKDISIHGVGEWRMPTFSKHENRIIFKRFINDEGELFSMDYDGKNVTQITHNVLFENYPKISPDGTRIIFDDNSSKVYNYHMLSDTYNIIENGSMPNWTPNGNSIVFCGNFTGRPSNSSLIYIMDADGQNINQLTIGPKLR